MSRSTKIGKFALTTLIALTGSLFADGSGSNDMRTQLDESTQKNISGTWGGKNPSHLRANGPFIAAEFLYWRADEDDLAYAANARVSSDATTYKAKDLDIHGEWKPGARVALGYRFENFDQWDVTLVGPIFMIKLTKEERARLSQPAMSLLSHRINLFLTGLQRSAQRLLLLKLAGG